MSETEEPRINGTLAIDYAPNTAPLVGDESQARICLTVKNPAYTWDSRKAEYENMLFIVPKWSEMAATNVTVVRVNQTVDLNDQGEI